MKHLKQNRKSNCGQTCVAMLADVSIDQAEKAIGKKCSTTYKDLKRGLDSLGVNYDTKIRRCKKEIPYPDTCLIKFSYSLLYSDVIEEEGLHWIIKHKNKFYDPAEDKIRTGIYPIPQYYIRAKTYLKINLQGDVINRKEQV